MWRKRGICEEVRVEVMRGLEGKACKASKAGGVSYYEKVRVEGVRGLEGIVSKVSNVGDLCDE